MTERLFSAPVRSGKDGSASLGWRPDGTVPEAMRCGKVPTSQQVVTHEAPAGGQAGAARRCRRAGDRRTGSRYPNVLVAALALALLPAAAQAGAWEDFESRCLSALENQVPPVVAGLGQGVREGDVTRYALDGGRTLIVESAPGDGRSACTVRDPDRGAGARFDEWIARALDEGRYVAVAAGRWHSHLWIEPVLEVQKSEADGVLTLRIVETDIEA